MMPLATGAPQCFIVLMELGKLDLDEGIYSSKCHAQRIPMMYYIEVSYDVFHSPSFSRLFSCGTSEDGESFLVEWNESEGAIKRTYNGFRKKSAGVVQFDTTQNRFLAAGEDGQVKFWDMDNVNLVISTDANGGLQVGIYG